MIKQLLIFQAVLLSFIVNSQDIPSNRITDWTKAGLHSTITFTKNVEIEDYANLVEADGSYHLAVQGAIDALGELGGVIQFGEKDYFFSQTLNLPSNIVLAGKASATTSFTFNLSGKGHAIQFVGKRSGETVLLKEPLAIGDKIINVVSSFKEGDVIFIRYPEKSLLKSDWAFNHFGQIVNVLNNKNGVLSLEEPIRIDVSKVELADLVKIDPVKNSGIQNIHIIRKDKTYKKTSTISFKYATDCFVNAVESEMSNYAHIEVSHSSHIEISGSYFHHAHSYGSGGAGYGVITHFSSSSCLIEDNIFEHLRHSMIAQAGANGNVFGYNYSRDPYWKQGFFPSSTAGDMVLHGNYPFFNLFEGNIAQNLVIDGSHGVNGHCNTFFRNRLEHIGITSIGYPLTNYQNFMANEVTSEGLLTGMYVIVGMDHFTQFNQVRGSIYPEGSKEPEASSLYNNLGTEIGSVEGYNKTSNSAKDRYDNKQFTEYKEYYVIQKYSKIFTSDEKSKDGFWKRIQFWKRNR